MTHEILVKDATTRRRCLNGGKRTVSRSRALILIGLKFQAVGGGASIARETGTRSRRTSIEEERNKRGSIEASSLDF